MPRPSSPVRSWKSRSNEVLKSALFFLILSFSLLLSSCAPTPDLDLLSQADQKRVNDILGRWEEIMPQKKNDGSAIRIDFDALYEPLMPEGRDFLDAIRRIDPRAAFSFQGRKQNTTADCGELVALTDQWVVRQGRKGRLDPQYLPRQTFEVYKQMMEAMKTDIGKTLLVESGYRSPAYQLYTFLFYLPKHHYSLRETAKWIALPGYSEHGAPATQAIDFMNEEGVNGEDDVMEFEKLPEFGWLVANAGRFGFELSYPRGKPDITYEPWHWRHNNSACAQRPGT